MSNTIDKLAGLVGMALISAFLLGLAESIGKPPFWAIVVIVLTMAWIAYYEEAIRKEPLGEHDK